MNHIQIQIGAEWVMVNVPGKMHSVAQFTLWPWNTAEDHETALTLIHAAIVKMDGGVSTVTLPAVKAHIFEILKAANFPGIGKFFVSEVA